MPAAAPGALAADDRDGELNVLRRELRELQAAARAAQLLAAAQQDELIGLRAAAAAAAAREAALEARLASERARVRDTMAAAEALVASLRALEAAPVGGEVGGDGVAGDGGGRDDGDSDDGGSDGGGSVDGGSDADVGDVGDGGSEHGGSNEGADDAQDDELGDQGTSASGDGGESPAALVVDSDYMLGGRAGGLGGASPAATEISHALSSDRQGEASSSISPRVTAEAVSTLRNTAVGAAVPGGLAAAALAPVGSPTGAAAAAPAAPVVPLALPTAGSPAAAAAAAGAGAGFAAALEATNLAYVCADAHEGDVYALAAALDGGVIASGGDDRLVRVFETGSRRVVAKLSESGRAVTSLAFSTSGGLLAAGSFDGFMRFYSRGDTARRKRRWAMLSVLPGHTGVVRKLVFDASATEDAPRIFSASLDRSIKLTDVVAVKRSFVATAPSAVLDMDVLPGSRTLVSGHKDGGLRVWSVASGGEMPELSAKTHARSITSVCCLEDGYGVLTLGRDDVLKLSDVRLLGESVREMDGGVRVVSDWHRATLCGRVASCGIGPSGALAHWNVDSGKILPRRLNAGSSAGDDGDVLRLLKNRNPGCVVLPVWTTQGLIAGHKSRQLSFWQ